MNNLNKLKRFFSRAVYYLIKDPRHLIYRTKQAIIDVLQRQSAIRPLPANMATKEKALPALIIDVSIHDCSKVISQFRAVFGDTALVYKKNHDNLLIPQHRDGSQGVPVEPSAVEATIFFWPESMNLVLLKDQFLSAYMALIENGLSIVVVSHDLELDRSVTVVTLRDQLLFSRNIAEHLFNGTIRDVPFSGKVLRLLPANSAVSEKILDELMGVPVNIDAEGFFESQSKGATVAAQYEDLYLPERQKQKQLVFVFPIFLAVGGVERNTIEIMRQLRSRFDFVVITMERLRPEQGSLAAQAHDVAAFVIEMSEIVRNTEYLRVLTRLKTSFHPDLIWVCNGSPWFCDNALAIRKLFRDIPIVDQEVYDAKRGWIMRYNEAGIQSFDHFIAINKKIQSRFQHDFAIEPERISLIYSAIDTLRITSFKLTRPDAGFLYEKFGLPQGKKIFTFIARLSEQKRPLSFLGLAKSRLENIDECYVFVGDGELATEALDYIKKYKLVNVIRIPYIENTLELHAISDGIVFTSSYEGLPIAMIEALAMGVPAFSTDVGDIADVLTEFGGGMVLPVQHSVIQLEEAFKLWLSQREIYVMNLKQNEENILKKFSSENISKQYVHCWDKLMISYKKVA